MTQKKRDGTKGKKRLVRGKDWHAWIYRYKGGKWSDVSWSAPQRDLLEDGVLGKWVRVKLVEVKR